MGLMAVSTGHEPRAGVSDTRAPLTGGERGDGAALC